MKAIVDTNILVRVLVQDDKPQAQAAAKLLLEADLIAVSLPCLCEFAWVLRSVYGFDPPAIAAALTTLLNAQNIAIDRATVEAGLMILNAGGDFADGVIAYQGRWLGGDTFVSFDKKALSLLTKQGYSTRLLS